jgi:hypothetical protein
VFGDGRVTVGGDVAATMSCAFGQDGASEVCPAEHGFFNYTDYQHSALRGLRADFTADVKATEHLSVLGEVRIENIDHLALAASRARSDRDSTYDATDWHPDRAADGLDAGVRPGR